jgi:hypothetical protein
VPLTAGNRFERFGARLHFLVDRRDYRFQICFILERQTCAHFPGRAPETVETVPLNPGTVTPS